MRDIEVMRKILKNVDAYSNDEVTDESIITNMDHLITMEYIKAAVLRDSGLAIYSSAELTRTGYDFLTYITNDSVWQEVKRQTYESGLDISELPMDVIKSAAHKILIGMFER